MSNFPNIFILQTDTSIIDNIYHMFDGEEKIDLSKLQKIQSVAQGFVDELEFCKENLDTFNSAVNEVREQNYQDYQDYIDYNKQNPRPKKGGYIYFIQSGKYTKIGIASNMKARLTKYRTENPNEVELLFQKYVSDYRGMETILHNHFKEYNHNREWFEFPEGFDFISEAKQIIKQNNITD